MCPKEPTKRTTSFSSKADQNEQIIASSGAASKQARPTKFTWKQILTAGGLAALFTTLVGVIGKYGAPNNNTSASLNNIDPAKTNTTKTPTAPLTFSPTAPVTTPTVAPSRHPSQQPTKKARKKKKLTSAPSVKETTAPTLATKAPTSALTQATKAPSMPPTRQPTAADGYASNPRSEVLCYNIGTVYIDDYIDKTLPAHAQSYYQRFGHMHQGEEIIYLEFWLKDPRTTQRSDNTIASTIIPASYVPLITNLPPIGRLRI